MSLLKKGNDFEEHLLSLEMANVSSTSCRHVLQHGWLWINSRLPVPLDSTLMASLLNVSFSVFCYKFYVRIKQRLCNLRCMS